MMLLFTYNYFYLMEKGKVFSFRAFIIVWPTPFFDHSF